MREPRRQLPLWVKHPVCSEISALHIAQVRQRQMKIRVRRQFACIITAEGPRDMRTDLPCPLRLNTLAGVIKLRQLLEARLIDVKREQQDLLPKRLFDRQARHATADRVAAASTTRQAQDIVIAAKRITDVGLENRMISSIRANNISTPQAHQEQPGAVRSSLKCSRF